MSTMSTNLFAFLQIGARTIKVNYQGYNNDYTYLTVDDSIEVGDFVVVTRKPENKPEVLSVAVVVGADRTVKLDPKDTIKYSWIVQKVDQTSANDLKAREQQVLNLMEESRRKFLLLEITQQAAAEVTPSVWNEVTKLANAK